MDKNQQNEADREANHHPPPKPPLTPRCLIVLGHGATLLPLRPGAKSKWHRPAVAGVGDPGRVGWWRHPRGGKINGMISRLFRSRMRDSERRKVWSPAFRRLSLISVHVRPALSLATA